EGNFSARSLPAGNYTVTISMQGFKQNVIRNVRVGAGRPARVNATLEVGTANETVTITGSSAELQTTTDGVNNLAINGRQVKDLLMLTPGTSARRSVSEAMTSEESGVEADTETAEVGSDRFDYHIAQPITVPRDRSALIPIVQTRMAGERISVFNESARAGRPFSGLK